MRLDFIRAAAKDGLISLADLTGITSKEVQSLANARGCFREILEVCDNLEASRVVPIRVNPECAE